MKGVRITDEQREEALRLYASGRPYEYIGAATGVSKASMTALVRERSALDPDLVVMHTLAAYIREKEVAAETLLRGANVADQIGEAGSSLDQVAGTVIPFLKEAGGKATEYCKNGREYMAITRSTGMTYLELVKAHEKLSSERDRLRPEVEDLRRERTALEERVGEARLELGDLRGLLRIRDGLKRARRDPNRVAATFDEFSAMLDRGVSVSAIDVVSRALQEEGGGSKKAPLMVAEVMKEYGSLGRAVKANRKEVGSLVPEVERLEGRKASLEVDVDLLTHTKKGLTKDVARLRAQYLAQERTDSERAREQQARLDAREKATEGRLRELERGSAERLRKEEDASHLRVLDNEAKVYVLQKRAEKISSTSEREAAWTGAGAAIWNFVRRGEPVKFSELAALSGQDGGREEMPLPGSWRRRFIMVMDELAQEDSLWKVSEAQKELRATKLETSLCLRAKWKGVAAMEERAGLLLAVQKGMTEEGETLDAVTRELLAKSRYFALIMRHAPDGYVTEALSGLTDSERARVGRCLRASVESSREKEERAVEEAMARTPTAAMMRALNPTPLVYGPYPTGLVAVAPTGQNLPLRVTEVWRGSEARRETSRISSSRPVVERDHGSFGSQPRALLQLMNSRLDGRREP